jgi:hypothetical protein
VVPSPWQNQVRLVPSSWQTTWKKTEDAGRVFIVGTSGVTEIVVTGLAWRTQVCQQVFEEAAADLGKGLKSWSNSRSGKRKGKKVGFPRFKKKTGVVPSFRLRNKHSKGRPEAIRVGDNNRLRSITLPGIGQIGVHDDTRRLRRMLAKGRAKICFATITHRGRRWWLSLNIEATDLHPAHQHTPCADGDHRGWVGIDRGLSAFLVAATGDGREIARITDAPKALAAGMKQQRHLAKKLSRTKKDRATAVMPQPNWDVITITSPTCAAISCTRCPTSWSRPTTGSSSRTSMCLGCCATIVWPKLSPMRGGPSSPGCWATNRPGAAASSSAPIAGTRQAGCARHAGPSATI